ncbi:biotin-dependent carboxyltransferase family protein [Terrimonas pollutisoli]|uniref:5-oxoprolinase subunit C family protein n=1 Tax=Terrimonas pollutisoli TaxID=3034147 RepID=UPI0023EB388A|nr:biotin-dependent carboxyltransferase family protein [Terrimonas sp. H1YJ31]
MSIKITRPGILATLQDHGRRGYRSIGVGTGGAMDCFAMSIANYLAGNDEDGVVIEIHFPAPEIVFEEDAIIAITGANLKAAVDEIPVPGWSTLLVKKDSVLKFNQPVFGTRAYLAVKGGWQAEKWLSSFSTHLKLSVGGHYGRSLQKEDRLFFDPIIQNFEESKIFTTPVSQQLLDEIYRPLNEVRCVKGIEYELLDTAGKKSFETRDFMVTHQSDRMGYRLKGQPLLLKESIELISSPVDAGTIQLLPDGNCIVLMADHPTTGGYPRVGSVIKADLAKLAQAKPGQAINFKIVSLKEAEDQYMQMKRVMEEIKLACQLQLKN